MRRRSENQNALEDQKARGHAAVRLLNDPVFQDAVEGVRKDLWDEFVSVDLASSDADELLRIKLKFEVLKDVIEKINIRADSGVLAKHALESGATHPPKIDLV